MFKTQRTRTRHRLLLTFAALGLALPLRSAVAQDDVARNAWQDGRRLAIEGKPDSAMMAYSRSAAAAGASGDRATASAVARGQADLFLVYRGCADSAIRLLNDALRSSAPGDRSVADALVRVLAARGEVGRAREVLVNAYADVPNVGRNITRESITFLQGMSQLDRAAGRESAAMTSLNSALQIAVRMHVGDEQDSVTHAVGEVTSENAWILYDVAQLRLHARSPGIASPRDGTRMLDQLVDAWPTVADRVPTPFPVSRLAERLELKARACARNGTSCTAPVPPKCR